MRTFCSLQIYAFELVRAERALLVARHVGPHRLEDDRMGDEQFRRLIVLDYLHTLIELGAIGLIGNDARLDQQIVEFGVAPFRDVVVDWFAVYATVEEEEIVGIAVIAGPPSWAVMSSPACARLRYSPHSYVTSLALTPILARSACIISPIRLPFGL